MTDRAETGSRRLALLAKLRQIPGPRRWRSLSGGCFLLVILGSVFVMLIVLLFIRAPSYIYEPAEIREFLIGSRLSAALIVLVLAQAFTTFLLGLLSAASAAATTHAAANPGPRIRIVGRRLLIPGIAALLLKIGVLGILLLGFVLAETDLIGPRVDFSPLDLFDAPAHYLWFATAAVFLPHWLAEPFLRIRYSAALGALAGSWVSARREKLALGLSARLAFGLIGILIAIWGISLMTMAHRATTETLFVRGYVDYSDTPLIAQLLLLGVPIYALGQIVLPFVYLRYARVNRASQTIAESKRSFAAWSQENTAAGTPSGSE